MSELIARAHRVLQSLTTDQRQGLADLERSPPKSEPIWEVACRILRLVNENPIDVVAARELVKLIPPQPQAGSATGTDASDDGDDPGRNRNASDAGRPP